MPPGGRRPAAWSAALTLALLAASWYGMPPLHPEPAAAAEYKLFTEATYAVRPADESALVTIKVTFRNTTPNPPGRFSVFEVIDLAVQSGARRLRAEDGKGDLKAMLVRRHGVTVASIRPRQGVRYRDTVRFTVSYLLPDGASGDVRIRPSVVIFPVWSFGTAGRVEVKLPGDYEVLVDGNQLDAERRGDTVHLKSGPIDDPTHWLALLTATLPSSYASFTKAVVLDGGQVKLEVRAWSDDRRWGRRTLALLASAMPRLQARIGVELRPTGPLVVVESLPASGGELSEPTLDGTDIAIGFDAPTFTVLHQLAHAWFSPALAGERWIREGFASRAAEDVAGQLDARPPYAPLKEARARDADAFPLISWGAGESSAEQDRYAYAASWAVADLLTRRIGADSMRLAWQRIAGGIDGYRPLSDKPSLAGGPFAPVDARQLLDQLEAVSGKELRQIFDDWVFDEATADLLPERAVARDRYEELRRRSGEWGIPDPVRLAMSGWRFDDAEAAMTEATRWLDDRDALLNAIQSAGLTAPDRLRTEFQAGGGSQAARDELDAEAAVVDAYATARRLLETNPSPIEQIGLLGGTEPSSLLDAARADFAEGDLVSANVAASGARDRLQRAGQDGLVRLASAVLIVILLVLAVISQVRRGRRARSSGYTARP